MSREPDHGHQRSVETNDEGAEWPYASLVLFGHFGASTPEGKRVAWRSTAFLALLVASALALRDGYQTPFPDLLWLLGIPGAAAGMWWSYARYLGALDELARTLQLRAFAFAYGAAMTLMTVGLALASVTPAPEVSRGLLALPVLAEPLRGAVLVYLARKHR